MFERTNHSNSYNCVVICLGCLLHNILICNLLLLNLPGKEELDFEEIRYMQSTVSTCQLTDEQLRSIAWAVELSP